MATKSDWTQYPPAPKVPNFHNGHGYTLHYASPGWDVYAGTFTSKKDVPDSEPLFHARKAADAKQFVEERVAKGANTPIDDTLSDELGDEAPKPRKARAGKPRGKNVPPVTKPAPRRKAKGDSDVIEAANRILDGKTEGGPGNGSTVTDPAKLEAARKLRESNARQARRNNGLV